MIRNMHDLVDYLEASDQLDAEHQVACEVPGVDCHIGITRVTLSIQQGDVERLLDYPFEALAFEDALQDLENMLTEETP